MADCRWLIATQLLSLGTRLRGRTVQVACCHVADLYSLPGAVSGVRPAQPTKDRVEYLLSGDRFICDEKGYEVSTSGTYIR